MIPAHGEMAAGWMTILNTLLNSSLQPSRSPMMIGWAVEGYRRIAVSLRRCWDERDEGGEVHGTGLWVWEEAGISRRDVAPG